MPKRVIKPEIVEERIVACPRCRQKNRLYKHSDSGLYKCGACRTAIPDPFPAPLKRPSSWMRVTAYAAAAVIGVFVLVVIVARIASSSQSPADLKTPRAAAGSASAKSPDIPPSTPQIQLATARASASPAQMPATVTPVNNAILFEAYPGSAAGGELTVSNGTSRHAIAKLIDKATNRKILSFVVGASDKCTVSTIPDGSYELLFAFGDRLYEGTDRFESAQGVSKFAKPMVFTARNSEAHRDHISVTLRQVFGGNAETEAVSRKDFESY